MHNRDFHGGAVGEGADKRGGNSASWGSWTKLLMGDGEQLALV
jgi:hypothetical protein